MALSELKSKLNKLSTSDSFVDNSARGFTKDFKPGSFTKFQPYKLKLGQSNSFVDDYAKGFTLNMKSPNTGFKLNKTYPFEKTFGERNSSYNFFDLNFKVNNGFKKNFILGESQYKNVKGKNFTWPLDLKRVDYKGNNLSPIGDFVRQFPTMMGGLSSIMSYPESKLRKKFLYSTDIQFKYKQRYEFKKENQIRLDSNSTKHPLILQSLMDVNRYGWAKNRLSNVGHTTDFVRGGITTHLGTALTDQVRLGKFLTSGSGLWWLGKQFVLQYLNPRKETQLYNPLHINASIIPFLNVSRFINLRGQGAAEVMGFAKGGKGLYERTDGYDDFYGKSYREYTNKLAQYTRARFDKDPSPTLTDNLVEGGKKEIKKAVESHIFSKLGNQLKELAGKFKAEATPANIINSQMDMQKNPIHKDPSPTRLETVDADGKKTEKLVSSRSSLSYKSLMIAAKETKVVKDVRDANDLAGLRYERSLKGPREQQTKIDGESGIPKYVAATTHNLRNAGSKKVKSLGDASTPTVLSHNESLGVYKSGVSGHHGDKVSLLPYGVNETDLDLVKFQFKDMVNDKFIIFRATVSGLTDTISPEWSSERYIGRADSVHVYKGAERSLNFGFTIAPTTKQELFTLWEKLNYLAGLNYPKYTENKMVAPWIEFSFGNMYRGVPGFIENLSYTIPDNSPYEIDKIELPKVIEASMAFKYVGNNLHTMQGKHFDLPWLEYADKDKLTTVKNGAPHRGEQYNSALALAGVRGISLPQPAAPEVPMDQAEHDLALDDMALEEIDLG